MGQVAVGTCSWTDKTMIERWYPPGVSSAEQRLRYYAARFDTVEVDSAFYGIPKPEYARAWAARTPECFTFHIKAFALMTGHEVDERALHPELRGEYDYEVTPRGRVRNPDERMVERSFELFCDAISPLVDAGKMGGVLLQYPPWFKAADAHERMANLARIERDAALLDPLPALVEFRHASWVDDAHLASTLRFLSDRGLAFVSVDAPQVGDALPPVAAATGPLGYVRFHGRNRAMWGARTATAADRFDYLYEPSELAEWREPIVRIAEETERTWVMFNNCKYDYAPRNAREMAEILGEEIVHRRGHAVTGEPTDAACDDEGAGAGAAGEQLGLGI